MNVLKLTTTKGVFFNSAHGPEVIKQILSHVQDDWVSLERIDMTEAEYQAIPATMEAARLFELTPNALREPHAGNETKETQK
mgnify:CR=1 FL=1